MSQSLEVWKPIEWLGSGKSSDNMEREELGADIDVGGSRWNVCVVIPHAVMRIGDWSLDHKKLLKCFKERGDMF